MLDGCVGLEYRLRYGIQIIRYGVLRISREAEREFE